MGTPAPEQARVLEVVTDKEDGLPPVFGRTQESPRGTERVAALKAFACALSRSFGQSRPFRVPVVVVAGGDTRCRRYDLAEVGRA